jgi:uncharacterized protein YggE
MKAILTALALLAGTGLARADINVDGTGKVTYVPNIGYVSAGVWSEAPTAQDAWQANRDKVARILAALKKQGLEPRDLQTSGLHIEPRYTHHKDRDPVLVGYRVSYELKVTVRKLDEMGRLLDEMVANGANSRMNISFGLADPETLLDEARARAIAHASKKARLYAKGVGASIGWVKTISENAAVPFRSLAYEQAAPGADKALAIAVGEQELSVTVHVTYALVYPEKG